MHLGSIIAAALAMAVVAFAQTARPSPPTMVRPIPGVPISVESVEESGAKDAPKEISKTQYYRDAAGRMRIEMELPQALGEPLLMVQILDPVEGFMVILETPAKIAYRMTVPKNGGFGMSLGPNGLGAATGKKTRKNEDLGKQSIDGIEFEGFRTTTTSDEQPSLVAVDERWMSKEFGLVGLLKHTGPDGENTSRIQHADRTAPDPKLFVIPDDYRIREMTP
jgi:hypothetical protein